MGKASSRTMIVEMGTMGWGKVYLIVAECASIDRCSTNESSFSGEYYCIILAFVLWHACNSIVCISYLGQSLRYCSLICR